jgi:hypothetical protein
MNEAREEMIAEAEAKYEFQADIESVILSFEDDEDSDMTETTMMTVTLGPKTNAAPPTIARQLMNNHVFCDQHSYRTQALWTRDDEMKLTKQAQRSKVYRKSSRGIEQNRDFHAYI